MLSAQLRAERGIYYTLDGIRTYAGLHIWRKDGSEEYIFHHESVGEFLDDPLHQSGEWLIDAGWGGPPGPLNVTWLNGTWLNRGFPPYREIVDATHNSQAHAL